MVSLAWLLLYHSDVASEADTSSILFLCLIIVEGVLPWLQVVRIMVVLHHDVGMHVLTAAMEGRTAAVVAGYRCEMRVDAAVGVLVRLVERDLFEGLASFDDGGRCLLGLEVRGRKRSSLFGLIVELVDSVGALDDAVNLLLGAQKHIAHSLDLGVVFVRG